MYNPKLSWIRLSIYCDVVLEIPETSFSYELISTVTNFAEEGSTYESQLKLCDANGVS